MKIHVVHDKHGTIKSLFVAGPDYVDAMGVTPKQDEEVSVVEQPDLPSEQVHGHLRELYEHFRIEKRSGIPTIIGR